MTLDITLDPDAEEVIIVLDNHMVLKANKGESDRDVILCKSFKGLQTDDERLFKVLRNLTVNLFKL